MTTPKDTTDNNVIKFIKPETPLPKIEPENIVRDSHEQFNSAIQTLQDLVEDEGCKGFFAISIDEHSHPNVVWAGELEPFNLIGSFEYAKKAFMDTTMAQVFVSDDHTDNTIS